MIKRTNKKIYSNSKIYSEVLKCILDTFNIKNVELIEKVNSLETSSDNSFQDFTSTFNRIKKGTNDGNDDRRVQKSFNKIAKALNLNPNIIYLTNYKEIIEAAKSQALIQKEPNKFKWLSYISFFDDNEEQELRELDNQKNEIIEEIIEKCHHKMDLELCYKLNLYFDDYKQIDRQAFSFLYNYPQLNENQKRDMEFFLIQHKSEPVTKLHIKSLGENDEKLKEICKNKYLDNQKQEKLFDKLKNNLRTLSLQEIDDFKYMVEYLPTIDLTDWYLVQSFYSITEEKQEELLEKCEELLK